MIIRVKTPVSLLRQLVKPQCNVSSIISQLSLKYNVNPQQIILLKDSSKLNPQSVIKQFIQEGDIIQSQFQKPIQIKQPIKSLISNTVKKGCNHGSDGKCINCMEYKYQVKQKDFIINFIQYLKEVADRCKGHDAGFRCNSCLPPQAVRYSVDTNCKKHSPYPKGLCNRCMAPTITIQKQHYRHIQQLKMQKQFYNQIEQGNFRLGIGKVQQLGLLCIQKCQNIKDLNQAVIKLQQCSDYKVILIKLSSITSKILKQIALLQQKCPLIGHQGYRISNLVTVIENKAIMVSDQFQALVKNNLIKPISNTEFELIRDTKVQYLVGGVPVTKVRIQNFIRQIQWK